MGVATRGQRSSQLIEAVFIRLTEGVSIGLCQGVFNRFIELLLLIGLSSLLRKTYGDR